MTGPVAATPPPPFRPRALPDVERLSQELEVDLVPLRAAFEAARRMAPLRDALWRALSQDPPARAHLGHQLFFDARLSKSGKISCQSCHVLERFGVDGLERAVGHEGHIGRRNTPTVFNVGGLSLFFWDGRATSLEEQARGPLLDSKEMALGDEREAVRILSGIPEYVEAFQGAFPGQATPVTFDNLLAALAAYERQLVTPAPWDEYLAGKDDAISSDAKRGFALLYAHGCGACHTGTTFGGSGLERIGVKEPWPNQDDQGLFEVLGRPMDKMRFKVPSLRNVEKTAPYFHDGSAQTLEQAVRMMAKHQLGKVIPDRDVTSIVSFLKSLTGQLPSEWTSAPALPP